ncbi:HpcH/HpaI aldolase family protein [Kineococcus sp. SYSU DK002]|uniref:HpcH/HpaI aldolase family protein n=1 Tax=Kineococcus sp. SYSU DK002 TaxID=3383123 RepID=UPI003D7ED68E
MSTDGRGTSLRERAHAGEKLLGVLVRTPCEELVEMAAVAGFDYVVLDCEHGPGDLVPLRQHLVLAAVHGVPVVVRVGSGDPGMVLRVLDQGAEGVLVPHVDDAAQAAAAVASAHYPPLGHRGFATYSRAGRFGTVDPQAHREDQLRRTLVLAMVESPAGAAAAEEILRTPGLDGIMVGPADLAAATGPGDPSPAESTARVHAALAGGGGLRLDIVGGAAAASAAFADGADLVVYNLAHALVAHLRELRLPRP